MRDDNSQIRFDILVIVWCIVVAIVFAITAIAWNMDEEDAAPEVTTITTSTTPFTTPYSTTPPETTTITVKPVTAPVTTVATTTTTVQTTVPTTTTVTTTTEPEPEPIDIVAQELLACVIYQEAGADYVCDDCRRRVADVVLNRVESEWFPNTIEGVLTQESQYGRYHWTGVVWPSSASQESSKAAVERAYRIAEEVLRGEHSELYGHGWIWQAEFPQGKEQVKCCGIYFGR